MPPRYVEGPNGEVIEFPEGTSDNVISVAMRRSFGTAPTGASIPQILKEEALATPGRVLENVTGAAKSVGQALIPSFTEPLPQPPMRTVLPLAFGGPGTAALPGLANAAWPSMLTRLATIGGGAVLDEPKATPAENLKTMGRAVFGNPEDPMSMVTSPAAIEAVAGVGGGLARSTLQGKAQQRYAARVGQNLEEATGGVLKAPKSAAEWDALVHGEQEMGSTRQGVTSGRSQLGQYYASRVRDAEAGIRNQQISVPSLDPNPISLTKAVHDVQDIAAEQIGKNPVDRSAVGRRTRELRRQVWGEIEGEVNRLDPSGDSWNAIREARSTMAVGMNYIEAVGESGALTRGPKNVGFDSSKLKNYVSENRDKFIEAFANAGDPAGYRQFLHIVYGGGPVGTTDVLSRTSTPGQAVQQLLRSGGGAGTVAALPFRTLLPGLGSTYGGAPPFSVPKGAMTLSEIIGPRPSRDPQTGLPWDIQIQESTR